MSETYSTSTAARIERECQDLAKMMIAKNKRYGDSALRPLRIFSQASPLEQIRVRIDDKLSRLGAQAFTGDLDDEDVILDLLGYLILLRIAQRPTHGG